MKIIREIAFLIAMVVVGIAFQRFWVSSVVTRVDYAPQHRQALEMAGTVLMMVCIAIITLLARRRR